MSMYETQMVRCGTCSRAIFTGKERDLAKPVLYCSAKCAAHGREKVYWPPPAFIAGLLRFYPVSKISKKLGVSDTAVRKFCIKHRVPLPKRGYWAKRYWAENREKMLKFWKEK